MVMKLPLAFDYGFVASDKMLQSHIFIKLWFSQLSYTKSTGPSPDSIGGGFFLSIFAYIRFRAELWVQI
jgi:hypothetical protein